MHPPTNRALQASAAVAVRQPAAAAPAVVSRHGAISPAFAARFGASISVGFALGSRNAEARALAGSARHARGSARHGALPAAIPAARAVPRSRVTVVRGEGAAISASR